MIDIIIKAAYEDRRMTATDKPIRQHDRNGLFIRCITLLLQQDTKTKKSNSQLPLCPRCTVILKTNALNHESSRDNHATVQKLIDELMDSRLLNHALLRLR
jgi:hypothetical protein